jgi:hypothetical protein
MIIYIHLHPIECNAQNAFFWMNEPIRKGRGERDANGLGGRGKSSLGEGGDSHHKHSATFNEKEFLELDEHSIWGT